MDRYVDGQIEKKTKAWWYVIYQEEKDIYSEATSPLSKVISRHLWNTPLDATFTNRLIFGDSFHRLRCGGIAFHFRGGSCLQYKLYGYGFLQGKTPPPPKIAINKIQETLHFFCTLKLFVNRIMLMFEKPKMHFWHIILGEFEECNGARTACCWAMFTRWCGALTWHNASPCESTFHDQF